jgi:hypothetical protein
VIISGRMLVLALLTSCAMAFAAQAEECPEIGQLTRPAEPTEAKGCPAFGKTVVEFYRYVGAGEAAKIRETGEIPMTGRDDKPRCVYFTDCFYADADDAKKYLALPNKPTHRVEFTLRGVKATCTGKTPPDFQEPGGGNQCILNNDSDPIAIPEPAEAIDPLE